MWDEYAKSIGTSANNLTQAQKIQAEYNGIMKETQFQVGDAAVYTKTFSGQVQQLKFNFTQMTAAIGKVVAPIAQLFIPIINSAMTTVTNFFGVLQDVLKVFGLEMPNVVSKTSSTISGMGADIENTGESAVSAAKKINKAFAGVDEINVLKTTFDAPSVTPIDEFVSITYLGTSEEEDKQVTLSVLVGSESEDIISITNGNITIKTFVGTREATLRVSIRDDVNASSEDVTVTINSLYSLDNVDIKADEVDSNYQITAGEVYDVLFTPNEIAEGLGVTLSSVSFEFMSSEEDLVISDINLLMKGNFVSSSNITFLSQDINYEKAVTMTLTFTFSDGGSFKKSFNLTILPNLEFKLSNTANFNKSGDLLLIDKSSVSVMKNGGNILNDNNLTPDKFSFEIDGKVNESIFKFVEMGEDLLYLNINYDSNHTIIPSGESSLTVTATIIFELTTEYGYNLQFESELKVNIIVSAN